MTIIAVLILLVVIFIAITYSIRRRLLIIEWRYYIAFKDICSRVTRRNIDDVSDLKTNEIFTILIHYKEHHFKDRQAHLLLRAENDPTLLRNSPLDDNLSVLRLFLAVIRRIIYVAIVFAIILAGAIAAQVPFLPSALLSAHIAIVIVIAVFATVFLLYVYRLVLISRVNKLKSQFPHAFFEIFDFIGGKPNKLSTLENLVFRHAKDYRIREDSHAPIAIRFRLLCKKYPHGMSSWMNAVTKRNDAFSNVSRLYSPSNPDSFIAMMHDDTTLELIQTANSSADSIALYDWEQQSEHQNSTKYDIYTDIASHSQQIIYDVEDIRNAKIPQWHHRLHHVSDSFGHTFEVEEVFRSLTDGSVPPSNLKAEILTDIQTLTYFLCNRFDSQHVRIVIDKTIHTSPDDPITPAIKPMVVANMLRDRGFDNVQENFNDIVLRKKQDPQLVTILIVPAIRNEHFNSYLSDIMSQYPQNYIVVTIEKIVSTQQLTAITTTQVRKHSETVSSIDNFLSECNVFKSSSLSLPYLSLYHFIPTAFDSLGYDPTPDDRDVRSLISHVKSYGLVNTEAQWVINLADAMERTFGEYKSQFTLFCIPPARKISYNTKFATLATVLATKCDMDNSFSHVRYIKDFIPQQPGQKGNPTLSYDKEYFRDRLVILFDERISSGKSSLMYADILRSMGAKPVMLLAVAKSVKP